MGLLPVPLDLELHRVGEQVGHRLAATDQGLDAQPGAPRLIPT